LLLAHTGSGQHHLLLQMLAISPDISDWTRWTLMTACHQLRWVHSTLFRICGWGRSHPNIQKHENCLFRQGTVGYQRQTHWTCFLLEHGQVGRQHWVFTLCTWLGQIDYTVAVRLEELKCFIQHEVDSEALQRIKPTSRPNSFISSRWRDDLPHLFVYRWPQLCFAKWCRSVQWKSTKFCCFMCLRITTPSNHSIDQQAFCDISSTTFILEELATTCLFAWRNAVRYCYELWKMHVKRLTQTSRGSAFTSTRWCEVWSQTLECSDGYS
jgi:hypothetical protein